jgi:phytoene/squalene synthetase
MAAAALAARDPPPATRTRRLLLALAVLAGVLAAAMLESTFWSDLGEHMAHGLVFLPFLAWGLVAWSRRHAT